MMKAYNAEGKTTLEPFICQTPDRTDLDRPRFIMAVAADCTARKGFYTLFAPCIAHTEHSRLVAVGMPCGGMRHVCLLGYAVT